MRETMRKLLMLFSKKEKKKLLMLFLMMIVAALFETIGIGLIVPFVGIITNPDMIQDQFVLRYIYEFLNFQSITSFIIFSVVVLLAIYLAKNLYLLVFHNLQYKVILNQQVKLSRDLFDAYLTKPYTFHLQRNTANLLRNVNGEVPKIFQGIILSGFQLITEILITSCIFALLLLTEPLVTMAALILLGGCILLFFKFFRKKIAYLGKEQQRVGGQMIKWVNQGLGASKEVKVSGKESFFIDAYTGHGQIQANNNRYMKMLDQVPRLFIETLLVSIVILMMLIVVLQGTSTEQILSTMTLFAMATFRLMPSINRIVSMITTIKYSQPSLSVVYEDLFMNKDERLNINQAPLAKATFINKGEKVFKNAISLKNVSFRYPNQQHYSVDGVSLKIPIGQSVAFVGESGAGKTTLVDLILGLFYPDEGSILIDGEDINDKKLLWQQKIGYIPQSIFLSDDSIRKNVAFGIPEAEIDDEEVWRALDQAQLKGFVAKLPDQLETTVGERGVRISGGQRQRIGIARALYHNPEILFMDEATSALDNETEKEIMKAIDGLKGEKTLIIIAHRLSTIKNCDTVFNIKEGQLMAVDKKATHPAI